MTNTFNIYSILAIAAISLANFRYMYAILNKTTRPSLAATFVFVASLSFVIFSSIALSAASVVIYTIATNLLLNGVIMCMAIVSPFSHKKFTRFEIAGLLMVLMSGLLWYISNNAWWSLVVPTLIDTSGMIMVIQKLRKDPGSEDVITWALASIAYILTTLGLNEIKVVDLLFSGSNIIFCLWIALLSLAQRKQLK